jgi:hypothetical protein
MCTASRETGTGSVDVYCVTRDSDRLRGCVVRHERQRQAVWMCTVSRETQTVLSYEHSDSTRLCASVNAIRDSLSKTSHICIEWVVKKKYRARRLHGFYAGFVTWLSSYGEELLATR